MRTHNTHIARVHPWIICFLTLGKPFCQKVLPWWASLLTANLVLPLPLLPPGVLSAKNTSLYKTLTVFLPSALSAAKTLIFCVIYPVIRMENTYWHHQLLPYARHEFKLAQKAPRKAGCIGRCLLDSLLSFRTRVLHLSYIG